MRIWDIDPGYLSRLSLLGEHKELHAIVSIIANHKKGYSKHPETLRWAGYGWALRQRHKLLASEMTLRGYKDRSPVRIRASKGRWPVVYLDQPEDQFSILGRKYQASEQGRIPLPRNAQQLWSQHKYSVMARDIQAYHQLGRLVSHPDKSDLAIARELVELLRCKPTQGGIRNALQHMWGHVSALYAGDASSMEHWSLAKLLREIRQLALEGREPYLMSSTALGELGAWLK